MPSFIAAMDRREREWAFILLWLPRTAFPPLAAPGKFRRGDRHGTATARQANRQGKAQLEKARSFTVLPLCRTNSHSFFPKTEVQTIRSYAWIRSYESLTNRQITRATSLEVLLRQIVQISAK